MTLPRSLAALLAIGTLFGTAATADARPRDRHGPERGVDSLNQPVVERTDYVLDLSARDDGLSALERARLGAWFGSLGVGYGDRIFVEEPYGPGPARLDVARVAAAYGLLVSDGAPVLAGEVAPGTARVIVSRSMAYVPNCPNWRPTGPSSTSSNYGCAINSNLAAMIADPIDLVLGQAGTGTDATTAAKAIKVYREAPPTGAKGLKEQSSRGQ
ncbi:MAG TPA: CpaD family pilus assembly lipoprotein [Allosphingosinicella sp.]|nr:CpaD family pilus assembly lipoprotein [Allosphingosinicella sp.]